MHNMYPSRGFILQIMPGKRTPTLAGHMEVVLIIYLIFTVSCGLCLRQGPQDILEVNNSVGAVATTLAIKDCLIRSQNTLAVSLLLFKRENLSDFPNSFRPSFSKQDPCPHLYKLWVLDEPE